MTRLIAKDDTRQTRKSFGIHREVSTGLRYVGFVTAFVGVAAALPAVAQTTGTVTGRNATVVRPANSTPTLASFQISRTGSTSSAQSVSYATADGTGDGGTGIAIAGHDYVATTGIATFAAGQSIGSIQIPVLADPAANSRVQFLLRLSSSTLGVRQGISLTTSGGGATNPSSIASVDVDGDGRLDLVVTYSATNNVAVLLNTSTGGSSTYAAPVTFPTGLFPRSVAVADINGDGRPDIVVANRDSNTVSVLLNTTTGGVLSYAPQAVYSTGGSGPVSVAVADLNLDGRPDIVVANQASNTVAFLPQAAAGNTFSTVQIAGNGAGPVSVVTADVNADGRADIVVGYHDDNTVGVIANTGAGPAPTFLQTTYSSGTGTNAVAVANIDGDTRPDVIVAEGNDNTVSVMLNTTAAPAAAPTFATRQSFGGVAGPFAIAAADVDGDGKIDLLVPNLANSTLSLLRNTSTGAGSVSFAAAQTSATGANPIAVTTTDTNGDGRPDVAVADFTTSSISIFLNGGPAANISAFAAAGLPGVIEPNPATTTPTAFSFPTVTNAAPNATVLSSTIVISGNTATAPVSITGHGARFSINGGPWLSSGGTLVSGQSVQVQLRTDAGSGVTTTVTLIVGNTSGTFSAVNRP